MKKERIAAPVTEKIRSPISSKHKRQLSWRLTRHWRWSLLKVKIKAHVKKNDSWLSRVAVFCLTYFFFFFCLLSYHLSFTPFSSFPFPSSFWPLCITLFWTNRVAHWWRAMFPLKCATAGNEPDERQSHMGTLNSHYR